MADRAAPPGLATHGLKRASTNLQPGDEIRGAGAALLVFFPEIKERLLRRAGDGTDPAGLDRE